MMSGIFAPLPSERRFLPARGEATREGWIEHLTGVHSAKPGYYTALRRSEGDLKRALRSLADISAALCATRQGPEELSEAVLSAAAAIFGSQEAAMRLEGEEAAWVGVPWLHWQRGVLSKETAAPADIELLARAVLAGDEAVVRTCDGDLVSGGAVGGADLLGIRAGKASGAVLVIRLDGTAVDDADLAIVEVLANQALVAFGNARLYRAAEESRADAEAGRAAAQDKSRRLRRRNRELSRARAQLSRAEEERLVSEERRRIAGELHDSVAQHLAGLHLRLQWCQKALPDGSEVSAALAEAQALVKTVLSRTRMTIFELSCLREGAAGLERALGEVAENLSSRMSVELLLQSGIPRRLGPSQAHGIFHVAQEGLFNAAQHGGATHARLRLRVVGRRVELRVEDDGGGNAAALQETLAASSATAQHRGLGLMREWAAKLGGEVHFEAVADRGVALCLSAPLRAGSARPSAAGAGGFSAKSRQ